MRHSQFHGSLLLDALKSNQWRSQVFKSGVYTKNRTYRRPFTSDVRASLPGNPGALPFTTLLSPHAVDSVDRGLFGSRVLEVK